MFGIDDAIAAGSNMITTVVDKIWPDANEQEKAKLAIMQQQLQQEFDLILGQLQINKEEAKTGSLFIAGWRPFVGWTCGAALAYVSIFNPIGQFIARVMFEYSGTFPMVDTTITMQVLLGMLGLGGMRTYEKTKGIARGNLND